MLLHVGGKNLQRRPALERVKRLQKHHRQRIRFFTGGHRRRPDANGVAALFARHHRLDDLAPQYLKGLGVAEKTGDRDQHLTAQDQQFVAVVAEQFEVRVERDHLAHIHAPLQPTHYRASLVFLKVNAAQLQQQAQDAVERRLGAERLCWCRGCLKGNCGLDNRLVGDVRQQARANFFDRQNGVNQAGGDDRARHAVKLGVFGFLGNQKTASVVDGRRAARAV